MAIPVVDFTWQQGEDGKVDIDYTINGVPIDLSLYSLRMDIRVQGFPTIIYSINSEDSDPDTEDEVFLGLFGEIRITVPRSASLTSPISENINSVLEYDIFLRGPDNLQEKIMKGTIFFEESVTLWP